MMSGVFHIERACGPQHMHTVGGARLSSKSDAESTYMQNMWAQFPIRIRRTRAVNGAKWPRECLFDICPKRTRCLAGCAKIESVMCIWGKTPVYLVRVASRQHCGPPHAALAHPADMSRP
jgi:hypothetical protein